MSDKQHAPVIIKAGEFKRGDRWRHRDFDLIFSATGNLELRAAGTGRLLWESGTSGSIKLAMQEDGNLVIYAENDHPMWATHTHGNPHATLHFQVDGNLVIYSAQGKSLWSTKTHRA